MALWGAMQSSRGTGSKLKQESSLHILGGQSIDGPMIIRADPSDYETGFVCEEP